MVNGGQWVIREDPRQVRELAEKVLPQMPLAMEVAYGDRRIGVIHADVTSGIWGQFNRDKDLWARSRISGTGMGEVIGIDLVVVGHTVIDRVARIDNVVHLDTGGVFDGTLQLLEAGELFRL